jgi:hypothetical protein
MADHASVQVDQELTDVPSRTGGEQRQIVVGEDCDIGTQEVECSAIEFQG